MTIAPPTFAPLLPQRASPAHFTAENEASPAATDFAQLLAVLLAGNFASAAELRLPNAHPDLPRKAAELAPPLGTPVEAFSAAQLLVGMALDPAGRFIAETAAGLREDEIAERPEAATSVAIHDVIPHSLGPARPQFAPPEIAAPAAPDRANPATLSPDTPASAISAPLAPDSRTTAYQPVTLARPEAPQRLPAARINDAARQRPASADPAPSTQPGRSSPFGAQLISAEGGLRLVLRLPKLAEGERAALEAALERLLESHGHRHTAIVIHEISEG
ncbi:MAG TPA: hypothetical protein VL017_03135 [Devosia sp.]|nr:hypothetical protein [Sphingomonadaceae bacterium]HTO27565.1 hypothetical protein [Devosia sp.]